MKFLSKITLLIITLFNPYGNGDQRQPIELGFADCHTVRAAKVKGQPQEYITGIVIRFLSKDGKRESFAVSHYEGYVSVPFRPGTYCFEAYDKKGLQLELDADQARCFDIRAHENLEVGVVVAAK